MVCLSSIYRSILGHSGVILLAGQVHWVTSCCIPLQKHSPQSSYWKDLMVSLQLIWAYQASTGTWVLTTTCTWYKQLVMRKQLVASPEPITMKRSWIKQCMLHGKIKKAWTGAYKVYNYIYIHVLLITWDAKVGSPNVWVWTPSRHGTL